MILRNNIKLILLIVLYFAFIIAASAQTYIGQKVKVNIFSSTPVEDIKAASNSGTAVLTTDKQEIAVQVPIKSFVFDKKLMQEHFNENYMESDKFPNAKFSGTIQQDIDWKKDGEFNVSVKGMLTVHGVSQPRTIQGTITKKGNAIAFSSVFDVACAAHQIKIPTIVFTKIAEVIKVKVEGQLTFLK